MIHGPLKIFISILFLIIYPCHKGLADTLYLKDKSSLKGIVVEDYADRIVYSTIDGEKEILKSHITRIEYDEPIDNLINLGDSAFKNGYYKAAFKYYLLAQEINPNIADLNDKIYYTETIIYRTPEIQKREHLALKQEIISGRIKRPSSSKEITPWEALQKEMGISISRKKHGRFYISDIAKDSPFKKAGALKDDGIVAIWSELCDYLTFQDLYTFLSNPHEPMTAITIERNLWLQDDKPLGAKIIMKWEGAVVDILSEDGAAKEAGIKNGDSIIAIDGKTIRYIPLNTVLKYLKERGPKTSITIRRKLTVYKSI